MWSDWRLPSASDILRYILSCRASAIYGLPINLRYIWKRCSPLTHKQKIKRILHSFWTVLHILEKSSCSSYVKAWSILQWFWPVLGKSVRLSNTCTLATLLTRTLPEQKKWKWKLKKKVKEEIKEWKWKRKQLLNTCILAYSHGHCLSKKSKSGNLKKMKVEIKEWKWKRTPAFLHIHTGHCLSKKSKSGN